MIELDLSEPLINGFIIFLNDTCNHSFAIQFFLFKLNFLIILNIFHQSFLNLMRKTIIILVLVWLAALRSKLRLFWILSKLDSLFLDLSFEFLILNNVIHIFLFKIIDFLDWVILNHNNIIIAKNFPLLVDLLWLVADTLLNLLNYFLIFKINNCLLYHFQLSFQSGTLFLFFRLKILKNMNCLLIRILAGLHCSWLLLQIVSFYFNQISFLFQFLNKKL